MKYDEKYMRRALELAAHGFPHVSPNPMVGAVIVGSNGHIIGEGYHRRWGEGHAEVNAVAAVACKEDLHDATMYVTLEPCSHWGKTPPCAKLIIDSGIPRVVVGATDPFPQVAGRGLKMLREAGVEVVEGVLADKCRELNRKFFTAHTLGRPWVTLKWAQTADGFTDRIRKPGEAAAKISSDEGQMLVHRERAAHDAILIGSETLLSDRPALDCRRWPGGRNPLPVIADRRCRISTADITTTETPLIITDCATPAQLLEKLYARGITSVLVEGGPTLLRSFIERGLWDEARVEVNDTLFLGAEGASPAPALSALPQSIENVGGNRVMRYRNPSKIV